MLLVLLRKRNKTTLTTWKSLENEVVQIWKSLENDSQTLDIFLCLSTFTVTKMTDYVSVGVGRSKRTHAVHSTDKY